MVVLGVFVVSTLSLLHLIGFSDGLLTPTLQELIDFLNYASFTSHNIASCAT